MLALQDTDGNRAVVDEGESANVTATFVDLDAESLDKASISTITCTLRNQSDGAIINSREDQDVLDANDATVTSAGVLTLRLQPLDNAIQSSTIEAGEIETHVLQLAWTWNDGTTDRTGKEERAILVRKLHPGTGGGSKWLG